MLPCETYCRLVVSIFILSLVYYEHMTLRNYSPLESFEIIPVI